MTQTLICGDCLEILPTLEAGSVDMVMADPPYGTTQCRWDSVIPLEPMWEQLRRVTRPNAAIVLMASQPFTTKLISSNYKMFKYCWVWDKGQGTGFLNAKKQPLRICEDVCVFYRAQPNYAPQMRTGFKPYTCKQGDKKSLNYGDYTGWNQTGAITTSNGERYPLTLIKFSRDKPKIHSTQKPVALMEYLIKTYTNEGEVVLDFVMGSGTTGLAAKNLNRNFIGIEKDEAYFDIATKRLSND